MKKFIVFLIFSGLAFGLEINKFQVDIYSKSNVLRKVELDLDIELRDENAKKSAIYDALNVIIGSFYAEDLMTSMGKENFKQSFIKYTAKKHSITIDEVYILGLKFVDELMIDKIIETIQNRDLCKSNQGKTKSPVSIPKPQSIDINNNLSDFGKDFGEN